MRTGLNLIKTDVDKTDIVVGYMELIPDGRLIYSEKRLYELNDEDLSIKNYTNGKIYYFNNPNDYLKVYNTVSQAVIYNGSITILNGLLRHFVGDTVWNSGKSHINHQ